MTTTTTPQEQYTDNDRELIEQAIRMPYYMWMEIRDMANRADTCAARNRLCDISHWGKKYEENHI